MEDDTRFGFLDSAVEAEEVYNPTLISNSGKNTMRRALRSELRRADEFVFSVAFITSGALAKLKEDLLEFEGPGTIITSDYLGFNEPDVFRELLRLPKNISVYIHENRDRGFHSKGYLFTQEHPSRQTMTAIVGSSNLTPNALLRNQEWNLKFSALPDGDIVDQLDSAMKEQIRHSIPLSEDWIDDYERRRVVPERAVLKPGGGVMAAKDVIQPNQMQVEALESINDLRIRGERRALVISATGTGKTILAALAVRSARPNKFLFIVHSEQILNRAIEEFQKVLGAPEEEFGKFGGRSRDLSKKYTFATIQSISRREHLEQIDPEAFDFVLIDEVHRAGAERYVRVIDYLQPQFLLGLTATPERTDEFDVFALFNHNVAYEIRLQKALEEDMLVPFDYFGVTDYIDDDGNTVDDDVKSLEKLASQERIDHIMKALWTYGFPRGVKGLIFCSRKKEAEELSKLLNQQVISGRRLRTAFLTGDDDVEERMATVRELEAGNLDYILTVDIFNEGIDIRSINQIVMLRSTESSIIFTQQLGRGLRKNPGKTHLRVIDFIGNYRNNFLIPIALFGNNSLNKESIRRQLIEADAQGAITGLSSVNFDEISRQRIFDSLAKSSLDSMANLKKAVRELEKRIGSVPTRLDFARHGTADPVVIAEKRKDYWTFLAAGEFVDTQPTEEQIPYLRMLDRKILPSKRAAEVLILEYLLENGSATVEECREYLAERHVNHSDDDVRTAISVLTMEFFPDKDQKFLEYIKLLQRDGTSVSLDDDFRKILNEDAEFAGHVRDVVEATKFLVRHNHSWSGDLLIGHTYGREDVCLMLNFQKIIIPQNIGGYYIERKDDVPQVCPIFITYHKDEDISVTTKYEDEFLDPKTLRWFTKSGRTITGKAESVIIANEVPLPVFVKKDDADGTDFYYLGRAQARDAVNSTMPGKNNKSVDVAHMKLDLEVEVDRSLYDYFCSTTVKEAE